MNATARVTAALIVALVTAVFQTPITAHSGLRLSSPLEGSALGASPTHVQLTFIERPEPSLATIRVSDTSGQTYQTGQPESVSGDPLTLAIAVRTLPRGVYVVHWRVVSAIDGHATTGAFAFGVQVEPTGPPPEADTPASASVIEVAGRSAFLAGLIVVLGAATYQLLRLGDAPWMRFAGGGALAAASGLTLLILAQWRAGDTALAALIGTSIGRAWIGRTASIAVMATGIGLASAGGRRRAVMQLGAAVAWLAACGGIAVHALSGHAAAGRLPVASTVTVHAIHVAAAGVWIGGLAVVIAGLRHSATHARALRRFSTLAAAGLILVTITGIARGLHEVGRWSDLTGTSYGALVIGKGLLLVAIAALGAMNRWRHVPAAADNPQPLRRTALAEMALALVAVVIAGALATLPPPAAAYVRPGIEASGADFATTVRATLTAVSDQPGPNRFSVALEDYDSAASISADRVTLRFTPIDDADVTATTLALSEDAKGLYTGTGANVAFDGRWRINVLIERGARSADVPVEIEARGRPHPTTLMRFPNEPPAHRIEVSPEATVYIRVVPEQAGPTNLQIWFRDALFEPLTVTNVVATVQSGEGSVQPLVISRVDRHQVTARAVLERGVNRIAVIARTETGGRLRTTLEVIIPRGG